MKLRITGEKQTINGTLSDFQMYTCMFDPTIRESTKNMFLEPFTLSIAGSTPEGKGLHIEAYMTTIYIGVSVYTIELLNNVLKTISTSADLKGAVLEELIDMSNLWNMRENRQFWFLQTGNFGLLFLAGIL
jgi:vacuolar protein sorting-associated protein 13A/C